MRFESGWSTAVAELDSGAAATDATGDVIRISTRSDGAQADGGTSTVYSVSGDAIAFSSNADNLVNQDYNGGSDVFVKSLTSGAVSAASAAANGTLGQYSLYYVGSSSPAFSPDGDKVAFASAASNLVPNDTNNPYGFALDIFIKDLNTGAIQRLSTAADGTQSNNTSDLPVFSSDGGSVAFQSTATNLVLGDTNGAQDLFIKNLMTGAIQRVSTASDGSQANGPSYNLAFSPDGGEVAFSSSATNLVPGDVNGTFDIFVKNLATGAVQLVSTAFDGTEGNNLSGLPVFSPDGLKIAFVSYASNLVAGDTNGFPDVFVKDLTTGAVQLVSTAYDGAESNGASNFDYAPVFSPDGSKIAFSSRASNLVAGDTNGLEDVFVKDLTTGAIQRVSDAAGGVQSQGDSSYTGSVNPVFLSGGSKIAFVSDASNLVPGDTNGTQDIFIKTLSSAPADTAPVAAADTYATRSGRPLTVTAQAGVLANDTDKDGDTLSATRVGDPAHGALSLNADGGFIYTPDAGYAGSDSFTYRASDGTKQSATTTVALTILADQAPAAVSDSYSVHQNGSLTTTVSTGVLANDTDPEGDSLTAILGSGTLHGVLNFKADGTFVYTPAAGYFGPDSFTYAASDGERPSQPATVTISVQAPLTANNDSYAVSNASPTSDFIVDAAHGVLANDTSPDGGLVVLGALVDGVVQTGTVSTAAGGRATVFSDGRILYDQPFSSDDLGPVRYNGVDSFTYRVRDADGSTADATVTFTVGSGVNHPVTATNDHYAVSNTSPTDDFLVDAAHGVLANDSSPDGGLVALGIVVDGVVQTGAVATAAGGRATVFSDGRILYDQPVSQDDFGQIRYNGVDSFTYRVRDADGSIADATVTLTIGSGVNHPVNAVADSYAVSNTSPTDDVLVDAAHGVLANDSSPDGGLVVLGAVVNGIVQTGTVSTAAGGRAAVFSDGHILYDQPFSSDDLGPIRYNGVDSFTYRVRDADGSTADATVTFTVGGGVNHPVTATNDHYAVSNTSPTDDFLVDAAHGVLANDSSPDGGLVALGIVVDGVVQTGAVATAAGGRATVFSDGRILYDQPVSSSSLGLVRYTGVDSFTYRVRDADGSVADATVTFNVGSGGDSGNPKNSYLYQRGGTQDLSAPNNQSLSGPAFANTFYVDAGAKSGVDTIENFQAHDILATTKPLFDGNHDKLITFSAAIGLHIDGPKSQDVVKLLGIAGAPGLRALGEQDNIFVYADAKVRPLNAIEGTLGDDRLHGDTGDKSTDIFFFDTALSLSLGHDLISSFGGRDRIITTTPLFDRNHDGLISFGSNGLLDLPTIPTDATRPTAASPPPGSIGLFDLEGHAVQEVEFYGVTSHDGVTYYAYGLPGGSTSAVTDLHFG